jgi:pyruvate dehydrogenase E2 component (dihydrolipoamide acetyltransferase)
MAEQNRIFASPLARRIANQNDLDLGTISGSGPRGRIIKIDIERALENGGNQPVAGTGDGTQQVQLASGVDAKKLADAFDMPYREEKVTNVRKTIANRLTESKQTVPHFYLNIDTRIDDLLATRKQINTAADGEYKISVNDFIILAVAKALHDVPAANAAWNGDSILFFEDVDVSVAVATDNGLITPIIKQADEMSLRSISEKMEDLATRARDNKLAPHEYQGGTFTISNLGMFGIKSFDAIINPPQSCILAVGMGQPTPVIADDGSVTKATAMKCTLSVDHRVVDGAVGANFLAAFKKYIESPVTMLAT